MVVDGLLILSWIQTDSVAVTADSRNGGPVERLSNLCKVQPHGRYPSVSTAGAGMACQPGRYV